MMAGAERVVIHDEVKKTGVNPEIATDNESQFRAQHFQLEQIRIRTDHPESNDKLERFHRSTREEPEEVELGNLSQPRAIIGRWVEYYNGRRLHASLNYLPPAEYWTGEPRKRMEERTRKLEEGPKKREAIDRKRLQTAA